MSKSETFELDGKSYTMTSQEVTGSEIPPGVLGAIDGGYWFKTHPECTGLEAACAAGEGHWQRIDRGHCTPADAVEYGQAFLKACVWTENA